MYARVQVSKGSIASTLNLFKPLPPHKQKQEGWESLPVNTLSSLLPHPHLMNSISTPGGQPVPTGHMAACPPHSRNTNVLLSISLHGKASYSYSAPLWLLRGREEWHPLNAVRTKGPWTLATVKSNHNRLGTEHCWVCDLRGTIYILSTVGFHWPTGCRSSGILHSSANFRASDRFGV